MEFRLTDGVDITVKGMIYFTDASSKHNLHEGIQGLMEGRPYGRFMSYDPSTKHTEVLVRDLYYPNGVAVSPDQQFVVFCETIMRRCKRYYTQGEKKGSVDIFIDNLPEIPDNIRWYNGEGQYWIALAWVIKFIHSFNSTHDEFTQKFFELNLGCKRISKILTHGKSSRLSNFLQGTTFSFDLAQRYPFIRKVMAIMEKYTGKPHFQKYSGVLAVDLEGQPHAHYYDPALSLITGGIKMVWDCGGESDSGGGGEVGEVYGDLKFGIVVESLIVVEVVKSVKFMVT
ncbi:protein STRICTOSIDINE SYNTHASE-LIKE 6-like [Rhododendron vialii]|uniref:protein STRICTOSIDINE SYNTHASE-LIKE 6-like n=1 Tax=Rhododendron vialii TaxID=182163 RepID=UPI00265FF0DC|nr:protein STRICTOSIDINE SYNTHASE-LIKE 6-like [Rhododendron vialii]